MSRRGRESRRPRLGGSKRWARGSRPRRSPTGSLRFGQRTIWC